MDIYEEKLEKYLDTTKFERTAPEEINSEILVFITNDQDGEGFYLKFDTYENFRNACVHGLPFLGFDANFNPNEVVHPMFKMEECMELYFSQQFVDFSFVKRALNESYSTYKVIFIGYKHDLLFGRNTFSESIKKSFLLQNSTFELSSSEYKLEFLKYVEENYLDLMYRYQMDSEQPHLPSDEQFEEIYFDTKDNFLSNLGAQKEVLLFFKTLMDVLVLIFDSQKELCDAVVNYLPFYENFYFLTEEAYIKAIEQQKEMRGILKDMTGNYEQLSIYINQMLQSHKILRIASKVDFLREHSEILDQYAATDELNSQIVKRAAEIMVPLLSDLENQIVSTYNDPEIKNLPEFYS
jgi:hypothetical protein